MGCWFSKKGQPVEEEQVEEAPKEYSWDKRKKEDKSKFYVRDVENIENSVCRNDVKDLPMTIENCKSCIIFLNGLCKEVTIDNCQDMKIITFASGSVYIRDSSNVELVTICGQLRTRDCRSMRLYLHCPTQPVIETTQKVTTYPLPIDFESIEEIVSDFGRSKFLNNWADIHDFGPVDHAGEPNWAPGTDVEIALKDVFDEFNDTFDSSPRLSLERTIFPQVAYPYPSAAEVKDEMVFALFAGEKSEDLATNCYYRVTGTLKKAKLIRSTAGKLSPLSLPTRAQKSLQLSEGSQIVILIFEGQLLATEISSEAEPGCSFFAFGDEARTEYDNFFNTSAFGNHNL
ncbi:Oidioi.mRNA.OKI2018_I69.PAR.g12427.t1.cds [Oikopleura dioica]|uniref:Oidioi.mRNA.OKI2018_I69.PAR.g12427.t1.cds n=1 Tax=Oikopleura dioica TaxID=34765 RepID=A0ABN7S7S4_OIKDI|nr:Oidioi.mRNA.OKI2018_I69.PAR.g12427.t1.cds [Oikopleura dioica]